MKNILDRIYPKCFYAIPVIIFIYVNYPLINGCIRGEHWMLLYRYVENVPLFAKLKNIALFSFPGIQRPQFLAFFVPYVPFILFGNNLAGYFCFSFVLHIATGVLIVCILKKLNAGFWNRVCGFSFFILSGVCVDVVNWSFFSYVQLNAVLVIGSIYFLVNFVETNKSKYFWFSNASVFTACFLYEITLMVYVVQSVVFYKLKFEKKYILYNMISMSFVLGLIFFVFGGVPNESDSQFSIGYGIVFRFVMFVKNIIFNFVGVYPSDIEITNLVYVTNRYSLSQVNFLNLILLALFIAFCFVVDIGELKKNMRRKNMPLVFLLGVLIFVCYVVGLCVARVPSDEMFVVNSYLDSQPRYYYLPVAIFSLLIFSFNLKLNKFKKSIVVLLVVVMTAGNVLNFRILVDSLRPYYADSIETMELTKRVMGNNSIEYTYENFIKVYLYAWINQGFSLGYPGESSFDFVYNTDDMWLKVLPKEFDKKFNRNLSLVTGK